MTQQGGAGRSPPFISERAHMNEEVQTTPAVDQLEEARKLIEQNRIERAKACGQVIADALKQYGCALDVELERQGPNFVPHITITAQ